MLFETASINVGRARDLAFDSDDPAASFALLAEGVQRGLAGALMTIVGIDGGAPRELGAHMAVLEDGTYCGYVSGGCVEAAVAAEALKILRSGRDAVLRFGRGSPFLDIRLPCGGGIDIHVHARPDAGLVGQALDAISRRQPFTLELTPDKGTARFVIGTDHCAESFWREKVFCRRYLPTTRLVVVGWGLEFETTLRMARAGGFDLFAFSPDEQSVLFAERLNVPATKLTGPADAPLLPIDPWTAVIFLFHDHDWETVLLRQALQGDAFFIGALGSRHTHAMRCARLRDLGVEQAALARIRGPVGLFGPTRTATSLAISVLAQIVEERRALAAAMPEKAG